MTETIRYRGAEAKDVPRLVELIGELFAIETAFTIDSAKQEAGLRALLASPAAHVLAACAGDAVIGLCTVQLLVSTAEGGPSGLIEDVVVDRAWRGRGIGKTLLDEAERWAISRGARRVQLLADNRNAKALEFYMARGWTLTPMIAFNKKL